jgi:hypothetical protein
MAIPAAPTANGPFVPAASCKLTSAPRCLGRQPDQPTARAGRVAAGVHCSAADACATPELSRRQLLGGAAAMSLGAAVASSSAPLAGGWVAPLPAEALELAPLGKVERVGGDKLVGLSADQVKASMTPGLLSCTWCVRAHCCQGVINA